MELSEEKKKKKIGDEKSSSIYKKQEGAYLHSCCFSGLRLL
jgi:hypothetical protein